MTSPDNSAKDRTLHFYGEGFFDEMRAGREASRRLGDVIHEALGEATLSGWDLGAGVGIQTARLKELGWTILGADFAPLAVEGREPGVEVLPFDLSLPHGGSYAALPALDCVICTEVAEHIPGEYSDQVTQNVAALARKFIVWSAAPPGQGGTGHVNCQPPENWLKRFAAQGWSVSLGHTNKLRELMLSRDAQHAAYVYNFFVLMPTGDVKEEPAQKPVHFTIVSTCVNAEKCIGKCIRSVREQSFQRYNHVIINAKSDDRTGQIANLEAEDDLRLTVIHNEVRLESLENCWAIWSTLPDDEVIVWLDGDDWLAHDKALQVIANAYADPNVWLTYGQFMFADGEVGFAAPYPAGAQARYMDWRATHLKTFRAGLVKALGERESNLGTGEILGAPRCLLRPNGSWVALATDKAVMWPLLEMAGEHYRCLYQVVSVYNFNPGLATERNVEELAEVERLRALPPWQQLTERPW